LDLRSFIDAIEQAGGDINELRRATDDALAATTAKSAGAVARIEPALQNVISETFMMARRSGGSTPTIRQLCLQLAACDEAERFWRAAGIAASDFVRAVHVPDQKALRARDPLR
jgi:hypothetical protein